MPVVLPALYAGGHFVGASAMPKLGLSWDELLREIAKAPPHADGAHAAAAPCLNSSASNFFVEPCVAVADAICSPQDALVVLGYGTVVVVRQAGDPRLSGFMTPSPGAKSPTPQPQAGEGLQVPYRIPVHLLKGGAETGVRVMERAQSRLDQGSRRCGPQAAGLARQALARLSLSGVPADPFVGILFLWRRLGNGPNITEWLAYVWCTSFGEGIGVLVAFLGPTDVLPSCADMGVVARTGYSSYLGDLCDPYVQAVVHTQQLDGSQ